MKKTFKNLMFFMVFSLIFLSSGVLAMLNPAMVYCRALGYRYEIVNNTGYCIFPDGNKADAWKFLLGEEGQNYSYCSLMGYEQKVVSDSKKCQKFLSEKCMVCILPNGTEVEVTDLMGLSFDETICGDGICGIPENSETCPEDCPSGSLDAYCDGIKDGICDPDCKIQNIIEKDPDCMTNRTQINEEICNHNSVCEPLRGENVNNCPTDCHCGNGICEKEYEEETYCPADCNIQMTQRSTHVRYIVLGIIISLIISLMLYLVIKSLKSGTK